MPLWPDDWSFNVNQLVIGRIKFHGIVLMLAERHSSISAWPADVVVAIRDEARLQALWEASHRKAIARLLHALHAAGIKAVVIKGTALAYAFYDDPSIRRRGDTDLLLPNAPRASARAVLAACGFAPAGERRPTQEPWATTANDAFLHEVDIHWRINDNLAIAQALEGLRCEDRVSDLPRLSNESLAMSGIDNIILVCINRASHTSFGYHVEGDRLMDGDRLIWAVDIKLVTNRFDPGDWQLLADLATACDAASVVRSGLLFAADRVGLVVPGEILDRLAQASGTDTIAAYVQEPSGIERFRRDLAAVRKPNELFALLRLKLWPSESYMMQWDRNAPAWPFWALRLRRLTVLGLRWLGVRP